MSEILNEKLRRFIEAQLDLFNHLGISRKVDGEQQRIGKQLRYNHGSGNIDIPTPYPDVLDYRGQKWGMAGRGGRRRGDDEVLVFPADYNFASGEPMDFENIIRFNILSHWAYDTQTVVCVGTHLPRPDELHYEQPDMVEKVKNGATAYGDVCLLILDHPTAILPPSSN